MTRCRIISRFGIGVDNVDIAAATGAGIVVTKVPDYCIDEVSDHAMALLLSAGAQDSVLERARARGRWEMPAVGAHSPLAREQCWGSWASGRFRSSWRPKAKSSACAW